MKNFLQIIIQEKGVEDWRSFVYAKADGVKWELRGYGTTYHEAANNAYERFLDSVDNWDLYGYPIGDE